MERAATEVRTISATEDAIQKLEDATPSKSINVPESYHNLLASQEDVLWKYMPSSFERRRTLTIQFLFMGTYFLLATIGLGK